MLTVQQAKKELMKGIQSYLLKKEDGKYMLEEVNKLPFYLLGAPGIGKTQIVGQVAEELGIGFASTSITHHSRNTVLGLPVITELIGKDGDNVKYTKYTMSEILADVQERYEKGEREGILLLDEFASMAESLIAPMLAFLQTKNIGNYVLPEGWIIVLCSNPPSYNRTAREFDTAIMDRVRVINIEYSAKEFISYGMEKNLHKTILEYLRIHKSHTYICTSGKGEFVTTRGWENLSHCISAYETMNMEVNKEVVMQYIKSGEVAHSFYSYYITVGKNLPTEILSDILSGINVQRNLLRLKNVDVATKWGILNQLYYEVTESTKEHEEEHNLYVRLCATYKYLCERQEKVPDTWDFYDILRTHARGDNSFNDRMETEVFGVTEITEEEQGVYAKLISLIKQEKIDDNLGNIVRLEETSQELTNEKILKAMKKFIGEQKSEVVKLISGTNDKITNVITFFSSMEDDDRYFTDAFVEKISQNQGILDVLLLCKNNAYSRAVMNVNSVLGRGLGDVAS